MTSVDGMKECLVCSGRVRLQISERDSAVRVFKCQNPACGAEFGVVVEEGYIEDVTGEVLQVIE